MALRVWLPLNGNLENKGASGITVTNNGATINDSGKIGKCYDFGAVNSAWINTDYTYDSINTNWSLACWVKPTGKGCVVRSNTKYSPIIDFQGTNNGLRVFYWYSTSSYYMISLNKTETPNDVWAHICVTSNGSIMSLYLNGALKSTTNISGNPTPYITGHLQIGYSEVMGVSESLFHGSLNDIRIYDHCLSKQEVKEIAQGLVLHYKLNGVNGGIGENLYTGSKNFSGSWVNGSAWTTSSETYKDFVVKQKSSTWGGLAQNITATAGDIFTISFWGKVESGGNIQSVHRSNLGNVTTGLTVLNGNFSSGYIWVQNSDNGTQWKRYWATLRVDGTDITYLQWRLENSVSGKNFYIAGIKLEKGSIATPWTPAASEGGVSNSNTKIIDSSGYGHHGEIINTVTQEINSPRYNSAAHISSTSSKIKISGLTTTGFGNSYSFAWWAKISSTTPMHWGFSDGIRLNGMYTGRLWNTGDGSNNPLYKPGTTTQVTAPTVNVWHHWVMTGDGSKCRVYQDGVLWGEAKTYKAISGTTIYINGWDTGTNYCSDNLSISDFRIYATALSAEDIELLYNTPTLIDKGNSWHTHEFYEEEIGRELMAGKPFTNAYGSHNYLTTPFTNYNSNGEMTFTKTVTNAGSEYIKIYPAGSTYYYDMEVSIAAGNQFYVGFERYDANKTSRSNNACVYVLSIKPSSDIVHQRYFGTVNLATDGTNPTDTIALRVLNNWSGSDSGGAGTGTVHYLSLREVSGTINAEPLIQKNGLIKTDTFRQWDDDEAHIYKNGFIAGNELIER